MNKIYELIVRHQYAYTLCTLGLTYSKASFDKFVRCARNIDKLLSNLEILCRISSFTNIEFY